jgi:hypothetical protein
LVNTNGNKRCCTYWKVEYIPLVKVSSFQMIVDSIPNMSINSLSYI